MNHASTYSLPWPELRWESWKDTAATLHMWMQIVGKTRLELTPIQNHWWNVPLYLSARGLTTSAMPYRGEFLDIEFDFVSHDLRFRRSTGAVLTVPLRSQSVASFYAEYQRCLATLGIDININPVPVEIANPIPFPQDEVHHDYDPDYAHRFWRVLSSVDLLFARFSSAFIGKMSPVHFFWGSFDLAVSRFSGRPAPPRENADIITREAYSHEVISAGFWPGNGGFGAAAFYCYTAPAPRGLELQPVRPGAAYYDPKLGEFLLRYDDVHFSASPEDDIMQFLQSTYEAGATLAKWDRGALERSNTTI